MDCTNNRPTDKSNEYARHDIYEGNKYGPFCLESVDAPGPHSGYEKYASENDKSPV